MADEEVEILVRFITMGRAGELVGALPAPVLALWNRRYDDPFSLEEAAEALYAKDGDRSAVAAVMVASASAALADLDEHGEYSEYADEKPSLTKLRSKWNKRAKPAKDALNAAALAELIEKRDSSVLGMTFLAELEKVASPAEVKVVEAFDKLKGAKFASALRKLKKTTPLVNEALAAKIAWSVEAVAARREKKEFANAQALVSGFADFADSHEWPAFFGQWLVSASARLVNESLHKPTDKIVRERLLPRTSHGKDLAINLAKMHARMKRKPEMIEAIRRAIDFGAGSMDFSWQFNPYRKDKVVGPMLDALRSRR